MSILTSTCTVLMYTVRASSNERVPGNVAPSGGGRAGARERENEGPVCESGKSQSHRCARQIEDVEEHIPSVAMYQDL